MVWFLNCEGEHRLGQILSFDTTNSHPVKIHLYFPKVAPTELFRRRFKSNEIIDTHSKSSTTIRVKPNQILLHLQRLTPKGFLQRSDQLRVQQMMESQVSLGQAPATLKTPKFAVFKTPKFTTLAMPKFDVLKTPKHPVLKNPNLKSKNMLVQNT